MSGGQRFAFQNKKTFWDRLGAAVKHNLNSEKAVNILKLLLYDSFSKHYILCNAICISPMSWYILKNNCMASIECMHAWLQSCTQATLGTQSHILWTSSIAIYSIVFLRIQPLTWINPCVNVSTAQDFVQAIAIKISEMAQFTNIGNIVSITRRS